MKHLYILGILCWLLGACTSKNAEPTASLQIHFTHVVGSDALTLDTQTYTNAAGEPFQIKLFKYYISNLELTRTDGRKVSIPDSYHLIDEATPKSKSFTLSGIPTGEYNAVRFMIGVDSTHNVSGAQSGALDPLNDMFWSWKSGYIFVKLEGTSSASTAPANRIEYHIGGFQNPNNIRYVSPTLSQNLVIAENQTATIQYKTDVARMFGSPDTIRFANQPAIMFDKSSAKVANNYMQMFSVTEVKTN